MALHLYDYLYIMFIFWVTLGVAQFPADYFSFLILTDIHQCDVKQLLD